MERHIEEQGLNREDFPILNSQPVLYPDLLWIWQAFHRLSQARQRGYASVQPLQIQEITALARHLDLHGDEKEEFLGYIQFMDDIFVTAMDAKKPSGK